MAAKQPEPLPLPLRINLAEAFIELQWAIYLSIPPGRGFDSQRIADAQRGARMETIDLMLDKLSCMYAERDGITIPDTLEAAS